MLFARLWAKVSTPVTLSNAYKGGIMKLVNQNTGAPIKTGDIVRDFRGTRWILEGGRPPHKESSSGFVWLRSTDERRLSREFYPFVIGAKWESA